MNKDWTRRQFITSVSGAGTAQIFNPFNSWAVYEPDPKVKSIVAKTIGIDTHNHMDVPFGSEEFIGQKYDIANEMKISGLTAICMTFCVDRRKLDKEGRHMKDS